MTQTLWPPIALIAYFLAFIASIVGINIWQRKRRNLRPPLELKLLRAPGETLRRRIAKFEEEFILQFALVIALPLAAGQLGGMALAHFYPAAKSSQVWGLGLVVTLLAILPVGRWALRHVRRYANDKLGYLGERAVGESLLPLAASGFAVFHDVPASGKTGKPFNIDHVAVGPTGIFAIETKTRRKGRARPGFEEHKVAYDGRQLIWPWAEDNFSLQQAESGAHWIADWINTMTGVSLKVRPVLALPGWYVVQKGRGNVAVFNHKQLCGTISSGPQDALSSSEIELVARQLESVCRDVEN